MIYATNYTLNVEDFCVKEQISFINDSIAITIHVLDREVGSNTIKNISISAINQYGTTQRVYNTRGLMMITVIL